MADTDYTADVRYAEWQENQASQADARGDHEAAELHRADADLTRRLMDARKSGEDTTAIEQEYSAFRQTWRQIRDTFGTHKTHHDPNTLYTDGSES